MKRMTRVSLAVVVLLITSIIAAGTVWGYSALRKVDATANDNIKIYYDGDLKTFTDTDGSKISPVIINGRTYLPLRAISDLVGVGVEWDGTVM
ncbi:stalk domain-containing protein [Acetivibrio mesophilus]|uniref:stalk domain-containing protein n=1 Tax=Acetivibrio mesophilus TaxID=2487273 RepID=UPI001F1EDA87|nr:stalk domain-containing protein [Acetivibrio mesophilus]